MNKSIIISILLVCGFSVSAQEKQPADYVNPFIGTGFHGHTYPGVAVPYGMVQLSPDTRLDGWDGCSGYHYSDSLIYGFSHTHLSGTGCSDYGDILIAPYMADEPYYNNTQYSSSFQKKNEVARAGYYSAVLDRFKVKAELTATQRVGFHRYTYSKSKDGRLTLDLAHRDRTTEAWIRVVNDREIQGFRRSTAWAKDQHIYFAIKFSEPFTNLQFLEDESLKDTIVDGVRMVIGSKLVAAMKFPSIKKRKLLVKVGISGVSAEGALLNLETELPGWDFDQAVKDAKAAWNRELSRIMVSGGAEDQLTTFYTSLYHCMVVPNVYSDVDGMYRCMDGNARKAEGFTPYTVFSLWDTYRAWHPLMTIIDTARVANYVQTFLSHYRFGGRLPVWELAANETDCMIGYHSVSVIFDAWSKGIRNFDASYALEAMMHSARLNHFGLLQLKQYNFIPADMEHEAVSKTLEYAYDDWCIAQMAASMGDSSEYRYFIKRAQAYKNLFDPQTHLMRPRINGGWKSNFSPTEVDQNFTEANSWQYSFYVPHDLAGLIALHGGAANFEAKLDELFTSSSELAGRNQSDITGLIGQYAHGNEPSHHMAYLYNYVGKPWKSQRLVRQIMDQMYTSKPDGICGNEDCGQMSAWYVMSALGFYPVCPGNTQYALGSPLFARAVVNLENGKKFTVVAENNSSQNVYIQSAALNGKPLNRAYIDHSEIMAGGELHLVMSDSLNAEWASAEEFLPKTAIESDQITVAPAFSTSSRTFIDSIVVQITSIQPDAIFGYTVYEIDKPNAKPQMRQGDRVVLTESSVVRAYAVRPNGVASSMVQGQFVKVQNVNNVEIKGHYDNMYNAGGDLALVDGFRGAKNFRLGGWQGYHNQDFEAVVDLGGVRPITSIGAGFLQDSGPWIMMPRYVEFSVSTDNVTYTPMGRVNSDVADTNEKPTAKDFVVDVNTSARYIKVFAKSFGKLPQWHISAGEPSWLFVDEIMVK